MYKAVLDSEQIVAVKFLNPASVGMLDASRDSFEAEISIMRFCKHDNIVSCLGAYIDQVKAWWSLLSLYNCTSSTASR